MADSGALRSYGPRLQESYARVGYFVDRILKGATAASLPNERPTIFELVVDLQTSRQIGVSVPQILLTRTDRVIA